MYVPNSATLRPIAAMKPHSAPIGATRRHSSVSGTSTSTGVNSHGAPSSALTEIPKNTANATPASGEQHVEPGDRAP